MYHARLRVALTVGIVTIASACAEQKTADDPTHVTLPRKFVETPITGVPSDVSAESEEETLTPASGPATARGAGDCPMQVPGATLTTLPAMSGVAFLFTTRRTSARDELRRRVLALRDAYVESIAAPVTGVGLESGKPGKPIEAHADYLDDPEGARLEVRAVHSNDVDQLRERLRADAAAMQDAQRCPALDVRALQNVAIEPGP